jgi:hypothetical protein
MAGDGGRAPDVSEQRAEVEAVARALAGDDSGPWYAYEEDAERAVAALDAVRARDPASVLAALLAEQPDATSAALETLLTSNEAVEDAARQANPAYDAATHDSTRAHWRAIQERALAAACRSLRPKAPKEDRDA